MNKKTKKSALSLNKQTIRQMTESSMSGVNGGECDACFRGPGCTHTVWSLQAGCPSEVNCPTQCPG